MRFYTSENILGHLSTWSHTIKGIMSHSVFKLVLVVTTSFCCLWTEPGCFESYDKLSHDFMGF